MMSIICLHNKREILDRFLLDSLQEQSEEYELILLDNTCNQYTSSPEALNSGGRNAKGEYLMFVHQDIRLYGRTWLRDVLESVGQLEGLGVAGIAGRSRDSAPSNAFHGVLPFPAGEKFEQPVQVQTLDGCLIIVPQKVFQMNLFDEKTCSSWYLYAVDYSLDLAKKGYKIYVIPNEVYHLSTGEQGVKSSAYTETVERILQKHQDYVDTIYSTVGIWKTRESS